jgi:hypothetical protein
VVGNFLRPADEDERDSRDDGPTGGQSAFRGEGPPLLLAWPSNASPPSWLALGEQQDNARTTGQSKTQQTPRPSDVLPARLLDLRMLNQALADLDDSMFADPLQSDEVFTGAR